MNREYLDFRTVSLHLDLMNLKERSDKGRHFRQISFSEILLDDGTQAVVVVVKVPRQEAVQGFSRGPKYGEIKNITGT